MSRDIAEATRMSIFEKVVELQDNGAAPPDARRQVAELFGVTSSEVKEIEEEGIEKSWPPLEPCEEEDEVESD